MPGLAFIHNMCDQDVLIRINDGSDQMISRSELLDDQSKASRRVHCAVVPQIRNTVPHCCWEFGVDSSPVPNTLAYRIGPDYNHIVRIFMNLCVLNSPNLPESESHLQLPPDADNQIFLHRQGIILQTPNASTWIRPDQGNVFAE